MKVLLVVPSDGVLPSGHVRARQYIPLLERDGASVRVVSYYSPTIDHFVARMRGLPSRTARLAVAAGAVAQIARRWIARAWVACLATSLDVVFVQGVILPGWYIDLLQRLRPRVILDLDDAIYLERPQRAAAALARASAVVAGSHAILQFAGSCNSRALLVPSPVNVSRFRTDERESHAGDVLHIGWLGSPSTVRYLRLLAEPLRRLVAEGYRLQLHVDGASHDHGALATVSDLHVTYRERYTDEQIPSIVERYDIGVMPMEDGPWEQAKCAMKLLIYMAAGKAAVASPVGENSVVVEDGVNGMLAAGDDGWTDAMRRLLVDATLRRRLGARGRATVMARYDLEICYAALRTQIFGIGMAHFH